MMVALCEDMRLPLVLCAVLLLPTLETFPDNYELKVVPHCGDGKGEGRIEVISDLTVSPSVLCGNGMVPFDLVVDVSHCYLVIGFSPNSTAPCILSKREGGSVYFATVYVGWGETGSPIITNEEQFLVSCSFGEHGVDSSVDKTGADRLVAPPELQYNKGPNTTSSIQLLVVDVLGDPIVVHLPFGKKVQLRATSDGSGGTVGLHTTSCDAIAVNSNIRYAVLRAGCGDGIIFKKNAGFTSEGLEAWSPYFSIFQMLRHSNVKFECNFTVCATNCDGNSCRMKRQIGNQQHHEKNHSVLNVETREYTLQLPDFGSDVRSRHGSDEWLDGGARIWGRGPGEELSLGVLMLLVLFCLICTLSLALSLYSFILVHVSR